MKHIISWTCCTTAAMWLFSSPLFAKGTVYTPNLLAVPTSSQIGYNCHRFAFNLSVDTTDVTVILTDTADGYIKPDSVELYWNDKGTNPFDSYEETDSLEATHAVYFEGTVVEHSARRLNIGETESRWKSKNGSKAIEPNHRLEYPDFPSGYTLSFIEDPGDGPAALPP